MKFLYFLNTEILPSQKKLSIIIENKISVNWSYQKLEFNPMEEIILYGRQ